MNTTARLLVEDLLLDAHVVLAQYFDGLTGPIAATVGRGISHPEGRVQLRCTFDKKHKPQLDVYLIGPGGEMQLHRAGGEVL